MERIPEDLNCFKAIKIQEVIRRKKNIMNEEHRHPFRSETDLDVSLEYTCPVKSRGRAQDSIFSLDNYGANNKSWS